MELMENTSQDFFVRVTPFVQDTPEINVEVGGVHYLIKAGSDSDLMPIVDARMICRRFPRYFKIKPGSDTPICSTAKDRVGVFHTVFPEHTFEYGGVPQTLEYMTIAWVDKPTAKHWVTTQGRIPFPHGKRIAFYADPRMKNPAGFNLWDVEGAPLKEAIEVAEHFYGMSANDEGGTRMARRRFVDELRPRLWQKPITMTEVADHMASIEATRKRRVREEALTDGAIPA